MQPSSNAHIKAHTTSNSSSLSSPIRSAFRFSPLLPHDPPIPSPLLPSLIICPPPALSFFLFTFPILPSIPPSLHSYSAPSSLLSTSMSCPHPCPSHFPNPSSSSPFLPLRTMCDCALAEWTLSYYRSLWLWHWPFLSLSLSPSISPWGKTKSLCSAA